MSITSNTNDQVNQSASEVASNVAYNLTRTKQETENVKNYTVPAYAQQAQRLGQETKSQTQNATGNISATAKEHTSSLKENVSGARDQSTGVLNSTLDAVTKMEEAKRQASEAVEVTSGAADKFTKEVSAKTNAAVEEGRVDVNQTKAQSSSYVQQVLGITADYIHAGQDKLRTTAPAVQPNAPQTMTDRIISTVHSAATTALNTADRIIQYPNASEANDKSITEQVHKAVGPVVGNIQEKTNTAITGVQQQYQVTKENPPPAAVAAKGFAAQTMGIVDEAAIATNPLDSSFGSSSAVTDSQTPENRGLATTRPSEPAVAGAVQPYDDVSKPAIEKPREAL